MPQTDTAQPAGAAAAAAAASTSSYTFSLVNNSSSRHYRFKWPEHPQLKFTPSVGHLHARASKDITVVFSAAAPVKLDGQDIKMAVSQISYKVSSSHAHVKLKFTKPAECVHQKQRLRHQHHTLSVQGCICAHLARRGIDDQLV
jgi:hypothetical protein